MKLIDLLVKELPKRGGWPESKRWQSMFITQDGSGEIWTFPSKPNFGQGERWYAENGNGKRVFDAEISSDYDSSIITREQYEAALKPVWNGEGLPPVGTECEWLASGDHEWMRVKVLAYHEDEVWLQPLNGAQSFTVGNPDDFRPIRTEAERKREEAIDEIASLIGRGTFSEDAAGIYDDITAHKITGVTLVPTASQIVRVTEKCSREDAERIITMLTGGTITE